MDLNQLLHRHQLSLMQVDRATSPEERLAHGQFASDYAEKIRIVRNELGAPAQQRGSQAAGARADMEHECWGNESGRTACITTRVVRVPQGDLPYMVFMARDGEECGGHSFRTMQEAEAFIRHNTQTPATRSMLYDREPGQV